MLNYRDLFRQTAALLRTSPALWGLALMSMFTGELFNVAVAWFSTRSAFTALRPEEILDRVLSWGEAPRQLILWGLAITAVLAVIWCISALCSGGIIAGTHARHMGESFSFGRGLRTGRQLVWPILVLDTFLFFPLFLLLLLIIVILAGGLATAAFQASEAPIGDSITTTLVGTVLCTIPLFLLLIPAGFLTAMYRYITLRDVVLNRPKIRQSIRTAWPTIKQHFANIVVLIVLSIGLAAASSSILSVIDLALQSLTDIGRILISASIRWGINTVIHLVVSVLWTLAFLTWQTADLEIQQEA